MADAQESALQDCIGSSEALGLCEAGQVGDCFADGRWRLVGQPEHDDACVTAGRVPANVPQAAVEGDQDPAGCGGCGDDVALRRRKPTGTRG